MDWGDVLAGVALVCGAVASLRGGRAGLAKRAAENARVAPGTRMGTPDAQLAAGAVLLLFGVLLVVAEPLGLASFAAPLVAGAIGTGWVAATFVVHRRTGRPWAFRRVGIPPPETTQYGYRPPLELGPPGPGGTHGTHGTHGPGGTTDEATGGR
jgi:hypothetical protein